MADIKTLQNLFDKFNHLGEFQTVKEIVSGHINDTYLIETKGKHPNYVLQKINNNVFKDVPGLINNKISVSEHLKEKLSKSSKASGQKKVLTFIKTLDGKGYFYNDDLGFWNLMLYIEDSVTYLKVEEEGLAYEAGKIIGDFLDQSRDFDVTKLIEVIPNFHKMSWRYKQFYEALEKASKERLMQANSLIKYVNEAKEEMHQLESLSQNGVISKQVTHNDTKISNILFDKNGTGLCMIDTDTVMPGIVHYDFGDSIRTICNTAIEDEKDLSKVKFNGTFYNAYLKGFLETIGNTLSKEEIYYLPLGAKTIIFIMGLRFLTDFLNNDVYYKTQYEDHNLIRAKNQFKLVSEFNQFLESKTNSSS